MIGKIGRYELEAIRGVGGMGAVYKAFDPQLKRTVAIKEVISDLLRDPRTVRRFEEEARLLAQIADPRVVTLYDFFQEGGKTYMVMEYVEGEPLSAFVKEPRLGPVEIHAILLDIAHGLRAVHAQGVVHRDIKPTNILLTPDRKVKIADFGIATLSEREPTIPEGTAKYLAPEALEGAPVDGRADLYALGVLAYELFLGDARFSALFPEVYGGRGDLDLRWKAWHLDRARRLKPLNELGVPVSPWLGAVLAKAVEKDPAARYPTIDAFIKDLLVAREGLAPTRRFVSGPLLAVGGAAPARAPRARPRPWVVAAAVLALAAGVIAIPLFFHVREGGGPDDDRGRAAREAVEEARRLLAADDLDGALAAVTRARQLNPDDLSPSRLAEEIETRRQAKRAAAERAAEARRWREEARRREAQGDWGGAAAAWEKALAAAPGDEATVQALAAARARLVPPRPPAGPPGALALESQPPGAAVFIDGEERGKTPLQVAALAPGRHRVRLALRFHEEAELDVEVVSNDVARRQVALTPSQGAIVVLTDPPAARLFLDRDWHAEPSPARIAGIPAGQHFLWVEKGELGADQAVFVTRGETTTVSLRLERRTRPAPVAARERETSYQEALDQAQDLIAKQEWGAAAERLEQALAARDTPELRRRLADLRAAAALETARYRETVGDFAGGLEVVAAALRATDTPELRRAADRLCHKKDALLRVTAGPFLLGSDGPDAESDERPVQAVHLDEFLIERTEVTNARYEAFLRDLVRSPDHRRCHPDEPKGKDHTPEGWGTPAYRQTSPTPDHPVVGVDWFDAWAYAAWMEMRLPTEAEWEKAAAHDPATGRKRVYPWGNDWDPKRCNAEGAEDGFERLAPVGRFPVGASPCGALDLAGNAWEWVADWHDLAYPAAGVEVPRNPKGPPLGDQRVVRGGSWIDGRTSMRCSNRHRRPPVERDDKLGFRCAQDVKR
jgi:formylglycine-generating enzyme required for sulfatase activity/tRNA A-37 threonylcarbamoyl transferase component Bud32/tetratricopeptide (TPR) repeat protein